MIKAIFNWSGGKDSALALHQVLVEKEFQIQSLVTTISQENDRISMHGVRTSLLEKQAKSIALPLRKVYLEPSPSIESYNASMKSMLTDYKNNGVTAAIFGDIFLEDLRQYRDVKLAEAGLLGVYPLWKTDTLDLMHRFIRSGFKSVVVCVNAKFLDESFLGRELNQSFMDDLPKNVDVCGENGEFHTFVYDGPIFNKPITFTKSERVYKEYPSENQGHDTGFWYLDLED